MKRKTFFILCAVLIVFLAMSAFFAKKLNPKNDETVSAPPSPVVVTASPIPTPVVAGEKTEARVPSPSDADQRACVIEPEYLSYREQLGLLVNDHLTRLNSPTKFTENIQKWKNEHGLPLPLQIDAKKARIGNIVYNNCRPFCAGQVHEVFVSKVIGNKAVEVLDKSGKLKSIPLHTSGIEVSTIDELNKKGVPFRSWSVPSDNGPWFLSGNDLFIGLDIEGHQMKISSRGDWTVVPSDAQALKLNETEPLKIPGCTPEDLCLTSSDGSRHFRAPKPCSAVVRHALDSVTDPK